MTYKDYHGFIKAYVVVHNTGHGVMESNFVERDVVFETDDYEEAVSVSKQLEIKNNPEDSIRSGWPNNTYHINVNTLSEKGKLLFDTWRTEVTLRFEKEKKHYTTIVLGGITYHIDNRGIEFMEG